MGPGTEPKALTGLYVTPDCTGADPGWGRGVPEKIYCVKIAIKSYIDIQNWMVD